ncbi:MAG: hypothetical protein CR991_03210 [Proteobacteria bacterium]|nr:MAG: hypothetical protein CR991_03210 [Pseudomonadota bacterium]
MHTIRWLFKRPEILVAILALIAILLSWYVARHSPEHDAAKSHETEYVAVDSATTQQAETTQSKSNAEANQQAQSVTALAPVTESVEQVLEANAVETAGADSATDTAQVVVNSHSTEDLLLAAREAYWSDEFDRSVGFYQSLLKLDDHPAYKGELANVYWKQGKNQEAVDLYAEIAGWMAEQGRMAELMGIKVYADSVDPEKAAQIGQYLK